MKRVSPLLVGLVAAALRAAYTVLPLATLIDLGVFALAGFLVGRRRPLTWWRAALVVSLPAMLVVAWRLSRAGLPALAAGTALGPLLSLLLIPAAALMGAAVGARRPLAASDQP